MRNALCSEMYNTNVFLLYLSVKFLQIMNLKQKNNSAISHKKQIKIFAKFNLLTLYN
jgi:hypothetical protein